MLSDPFSPFEYDQETRTSTCNNSTHNLQHLWIDHGMAQTVAEVIEKDEAGNQTASYVQSRSAGPRPSSRVDILVG